MMSTHDIQAIRADIRAMLREHRGPALAKLAILRERADVRNLNPALIERAEKWITSMQHECGNTWCEPQYVLYDKAESCIDITWHAPRSLNIEITMTGATYNKLDNDDDTGTANTTEERAVLWQWLTAESERAL